MKDWVVSFAWRAYGQYEEKDVSFSAKTISEALEKATEWMTKHGPPGCEKWMIWNIGLLGEANEEVL